MVPTVQRIDDRPAGERALLTVADGLATAAQTLVPGCTVAVVAAGHGRHWLLLAQRGPSDLSSRWRRAIAGAVRDGDRPYDADECFVGTFSSVARQIMLVLAPAAGERLGPSASVVLRPILDAGGILLDRALGTGPFDLPSRRAVEDELRRFESI